MKAFGFALECPECAGELTFIQAAKVSAYDSKAVVACVPCRREFLVAVNLITRERPYVICGTSQGWSQHRRNGETPCEECSTARNKVNSSYVSTHRRKVRA